MGVRGMGVGGWWGEGNWGHGGVVERGKGNRVGWWLVMVVEVSGKKN